MTKHGKKTNSITLFAVAAVLLVFVCSVAFAGNGVASATQQLNNSANANKSFTDVSGSINTDALRAQYFKDQSVQTDTVAQFQGERWVIVELAGENLYDRYSKSARYSTFADYCNSKDGNDAKNSLKNTQENFLARLDRHGIDYMLKYSYTTLNNGVAIKVNADAYNAIKKMSDVVGVYYSDKYTVPTVAVSNNANVYTTGIYDSSSLDFKGEGMVVAVLDTGLDYTHEAFQTMPSNEEAEGFWTKAHVANLLNNPEINAQGTVDDLYYNAKVPFAYDYADDDCDVYPSYSTHGTHVAGIVAGSSEYQVNKDDPTETFVGVAPEAQLVIGKVFTDNLNSDSLGGADSIDILAAVSDCAELGVDVINMSLGSSCGFTDEKSDTFTKGIYEKVRAAGISLVVAASNDYSSGYGGGNGTNLASNPDSATVGSPSTYPAALSVASINGRLSDYIVANDKDVAFITTSSDENGNEYDFIEQLYKIAGKATTETLNFKYVTVGDVGRAANYTPTIKRELQNKGNYDGTIALVKRGDITFAEKVQNAMDAGADACVIYNNVSGTIRMSLGEVEDPIPTCSIGMDAGSAFASKSKGVISVSMTYKAGPFMSDFSSWGPTPDLKLKPEITAHGGEIVSAVPGGYDVYSGTSMASPNMAGAIALLRQYLKNTTDLEGVALNALVNQMLMSTATIALNEEGNPYSPRKQGAGLAGIQEAVNTEGYITVKDASGAELDRTKLELGDDKNRTGVYTLDFVVNNVSGKQETYSPLTYVMTETLATDLKTVAEKATMLDDSVITYFVNGAEHNGDIVVGANEKVNVRVVIRLSDAAKKYIDDSFENGMYVEGFVSLKAKGDTKVTIGLPYLAFYGDWNDAPLFDYDTYEIAESEADTSIDADKKLKASAAATRVLGQYYDDKYIIELGSYLYTMAETDVQIYPDRKKAAVSIFDSSLNRTIYELYMVYAGLLRSAAYMDVSITDATTGETVYSKCVENVGKSYAAGGSNRGAIIMLEVNPLEWNLNNNSTYYVSLKGQLDYPGGDNPEKNTFDFQFTVDYEAPKMLDYRIRYEAYTENKKVKYRIYMDIDVADNQYVMDVLPCYIKQTKMGNVLTLATQYPLPVYGEQGGQSTVSFEITDLYDDYVKTGELIICVEDYAMNQSMYQLNLGTSGALEYPESVDFLTDEKLEFTDTQGTNTDGTKFDIYELSLAPNELYTLSVSALPSQDLYQNLYWTTMRGTSAKANNNEIFAKKVGTSTLRLTDGTKVYAQVDVAVTGTALSAPIPDKITILPTLNASGYVESFDNSNPSLTLNPNQTERLRATVSPWYIDNVSYEWSSTNDDVVSVDSVGNITAKKKGTAYIKVQAVEYPRLTKSIRVSVNSDYRVVNYSLYDYYGGPNVEIPEDLNIMYLDEECFQNNTTIERVVLPSTLTEIPKEAFKGCTNLKEIVVPSQTIVLHDNSFEGCVKLEKIEFKMFVDRDKNESETLHGAITIGKEAFKGCVSLKEITNQERLTTIYDNAFEGCIALEQIDLSQLRVSGKYVFKGCSGLQNVITSKDTALGEYMFADCTGLTEFAFKGNYINAGVFMGCSNLQTFTIAAQDEFMGIGAYALAQTKIESISLPNGTYSLGENAFGECAKLKSVHLDANTQLVQGNASPFGGCNAFDKFEIGNSNYYSVEGGILYNKDKTEIVAVPYALTSVFLPSTVKRIGNGAFAGLVNITVIDLSRIESIGSYAFANSGLEYVDIPSSITVLQDGVFFGCANLKSVGGVSQLVEIGNQAFFGCKALGVLSLDNVKTIGNNAFYSSGFTGLYAPKAEVIGASAFEDSEIEEISLPNATTLGYRAFASIRTLKYVSLGAITEMASNVFVNSANIESVSFAEGTTRIGDYAFYSAVANNALKTVSLPNTVTEIGEYAFTNANELPQINLSGVQRVGACAFLMGMSNNGDRLSKLTSVDLANATYIGEGAFAFTNLNTVNLANAEIVEANAFMDSALSSVSFANLKRVGEYAFVGTSLTSVVLPSTLNDRKYEYTWEIRDHKGRVTEIKTRKENSFGVGAFADIPTLTSITIAADSKDFFSEDGVLYSRIENGYVLEQYPANKADRVYNVIDNTVMIADCAFEGAGQLYSVFMPYTVETIGSYAFFDTSIKEYTFSSVVAPKLLSTYVDGTAYSKGSLMYVMFNMEDTQSAIGSTLYYANFFNYVAFITEKDMFTTPPVEDYELTLNIPKNGTGYDSYVWTTFFSTIKRSARNEADNTTHAALNAIAKIPSVEEINAVDSLAVLNAEGGIADLVSTARIAYNQITKPEQIVIAQSALETLLKAEKAVRDVKARLGAPVAVKQLVIAQSPTKTRYDVGEHFDKTGLVIKLIYQDLSEVDVTADCVYDKDVLGENDGTITATYALNGTDYTVEILVNINPPQEKPEPEPEPSTPPVVDGGNKLSKGAVIAISVVIPAVVLAGVGIAIAIVLRKKKSAK